MNGERKSIADILVFLDRFADLNRHTIICLGAFTYLGHSSHVKRFSAFVVILENAKTRIARGNALDLTATSCVIRDLE